VIHSCRRAQADGEEFKAIRRGWCLGDETFRKELLESVSAGAAEPYRAEARRETTEAKARRILQEELAVLGWDNAALAHYPKGDARKVRMARRVRAETSVTLKWIAEHLQMGAWTHVANRLSQDPANSDNQPNLNLCQK
jgi:putative transposase